MAENPKWDWLKMIPSWEYHKLAHVGYPGWELEGADVPAYVTMTFVHKDGKGSREIAIEWDDLAQGAFYYRDYTENGLPIMRDGDTYESMFVFQLLSDAEAFRSRYVRN